MFVVKDKAFDDFVVDEEAEAKKNKKQEAGLQNYVSGW